MEQLNQYLKELVARAGYELHLVPNKNPYMVSGGGESDIANAPLLGPQISMMVFPLIPPDIREDLPNLPLIQFVHPHNLGKFTFTIQKSPAGFNVTVRPMLGNELKSTDENVPAEQDVVSEPDTSDLHIEDANIFEVERF